MGRRRRRGPDRAAGREDELSECALLSRDERAGRWLDPIDAAIIALSAGRSLAALVGWTYFFAVELNAPHALRHRQLPSSCCAIRLRKSAISANWAVAKGSMRRMLV